MKKFFNLPKLKFILLLFGVWRISLEILRTISAFFFEKKPLFMSVDSAWANFDGLHYDTIARLGYQPFEQAFFPLYPLLIRYVSQWFLGKNYILSGLVISNVAFILLLWLLWKLLEKTRIDKKKIKDETIRWTLIFLVFFPTSFYFGSIYTESLFLLLLIASFYFLLTKRKIWYGITASLASATRLVGAFLLVPLGTFIYMTYLGIQYKDPLLFIHTQPAFGAERSGSNPIFLPQVYVRYGRIVFNVITGRDAFAYDQKIALLELVSFHAALFLLWIVWKKNLPREWIFFSLAAILFPTLSGTLSSMPRYVLIAFPIYIAMASFSKNVRIVCLVISIILFSILTMLFTQGNWVS